MSRPQIDLIVTRSPAIAGLTLDEQISVLSE